jgi:uncharacterized protein (DUF305 family)
MCMHTHVQGNSKHAQSHQKWQDWIPLITVFSFIGISTLTTLQVTEFSTVNASSFSMGFFFLYFSLFKMLDVKGFAMGYREYDIISTRWHAWGFFVPFIELGLGINYLLLRDATWLHVTTLAFSLVVVISVLRKLRTHETIHCACLGNILKVPLTWVSLAEYLLMGIMALIMLAGIITPTTNTHHTHQDSFTTYQNLLGDDYDKAFLHEMTEHHQGAIDMTSLVAEKSQRPELLAFARSIEIAQKSEISMMETWQQVWAHPTIMEHKMHNDMQTMYESLQNLQGSAFEKKFLELMIEHHQGALDMAVHGMNSNHEEVQRLAQEIVLTQTKEISQMHKWLHEWGLTTE